MIVKQILSLTRSAFTRAPLQCFAEEKNDYGIMFDQEKIKQKMEQINKRKEAERAKRTEKIELMHNNPQSEIGRKIRKYRQSTNTENLLHFADPSLEQKPTTLQITGFDEDSVEIDTMIYPPCMIVFRTQMFVWEVTGVESLTLDDFTILKYISPKPTYVIVGVNNPEKFPKTLKQHFDKTLQNFDVLQLFEANSQFNVTSADDINVVAFLITK